MENGTGKMRVGDSLCGSQVEEAPVGTGVKAKAVVKKVF